ncbi:MAG: hypothetical protein EXR68_02900 [Dehalococcoidia bacterium]|nr:hypothetical protein [Dehalococcoidia bacterium]
MTASLPLDEVFDRCIDEIRRNRATVEECLLRYPEHRRELEPLLRTAATMSTLPRGEQITTPQPVQRASFMAVLSETAQQRRRRRAPALAALFGAGAFRIVGPAFALAVMAIALVLGGGGTPAVASTLTVFDGEVQRLDGVDWKTMQDGDKFEAGVRMRTGGTGYAMITFPDGSTVALEPSTELTIETLAAGPRRIEVRLLSGRLWHDIVHDETEGSRFVVRTPDVRVEVLGTVFQIAVDARTAQTDVTTVDGEVLVVASEQTVPIGRGETIRIREATIEDVSTAPLLDSALTVSGPFATAIVASDGRGTGLRVDGVVFRQLRGITTWIAGNTQRFDFQDIDAGAYTLTLQRYRDGAGVIVLDTPSGVQRFEVDANTRAVRLPLRLEMRAGLPVLVAGTPQTANDTPAAAIRVAESERTKAAVKLSAQATANASGQKTPTQKATERANDRTPTSTPTRTPSATATRAATPAPAATPATDPAVIAYAQRLRNAVASGNANDIREALTEALAGDNTLLKRTRVAVIAIALENETTAQRITNLFVAGQNAGLYDALRAAFSANGGDGRARFDAAIVIADARRIKQTTVQKTPTLSPTLTVLPIRTTTPTQTPTSTPTSAPMERPTAAPTVTPTATPRIELDR